MTQDRRSTDLEQLVDETEGAYEPSTERRARAHWALERRLHAPASGSSWLSMRRRLGWPLAVVACLLSAGAVAAFAGRFNERLPSESAAPSQEPTRAPERVAKPVLPSVGPVTPEVVPSTDGAADPGTNEVRPRAATSSSQLGPAPSGASKANSLREELEALRRADSALRSGQPALALAELDRYQATHPRGVLTQERAAARIVALCGLGLRGDARTAAARFSERYPKSPQLPRLQASCALP